jgi:hypothetical protein
MLEATRRVMIAFAQVDGGRKGFGITKAAVDGLAHLLQ